MTVAVTPAGAPVVATVSAPVKLVRVIVAVNDVLPPCVTLPAVADSAIEMVGRLVTVTVTVPVCCADTSAACPRMVNEYEPGVTLAATATVNVVDVVPDVIAVGEKEAVRPLGTPSTDRFTVPVKVPVRPIVAVTLPDDPCSTARVVLESDTVNPAGVGFVVPPSPPPQAASEATTDTRNKRDQRVNCDTISSGEGAPYFCQRAHVEEKEKQNVLVGAKSAGPRPEMLRLLLNAQKVDGD